MSFQSLISLLKNTKVTGRKPSMESMNLALSTVTEDTVAHGLPNDKLELLVKAFTNVDHKLLRATVQQRIIRCFIPVTRPSASAVRELMLWVVSYIEDLPVTVLKTAFVLTIEYLQNGLVDPDSLKWTYAILFRVLTRPQMEVATCKLLQLITTPDLITRFRVLRLLKLYKKDKRPYVLALLSLYKTLRPDKVPEHVPVLTFAMLNQQNGEKNTIEGIARAHTRYQASQERLGEQNEDTAIETKKLHWTGDQPMRRRQKDAIIVPPMSFNVKTILSQQEKEWMMPQKLIVESKTIDELGIYILTSKGPSQLMSLLGSKSGLFYLQFLGDAEHQQFLHTLLHVLTHVIEGRDKRQYSVAAVLKLLQGLYDMQEMQMCGSAVVTRFVSQFLCYRGDEELLPIILRLMTRPVFSSYDEFYSSVLLAVEQVFCSSDSETRVLVLKAVGDLILNLHWQVLLTPEEVPEWPDRETLLDLGVFYAKLCNIAVASDKLNSLVSFIEEAMHFYKMLLHYQTEACKLNLWTVPSTPLLLACLVSQVDCFVENACELLLRHRNELYCVHEHKKHIFREQVDTLNTIVSNFSQAFLLQGSYDEPHMDSLLFHKISTGCATKVRALCGGQESLSLSVHPAFASHKNFLQNQAHHSLDDKDMEVVCSIYFPNVFTLLKEMQFDEESSVHDD